MQVWEEKISNEIVLIHEDSHGYRGFFHKDGDLYMGSSVDLYNEGSIGECMIFKINPEDHEVDWSELYCERIESTRPEDLINLLTSSIKEFLDEDS